MPGAVTGAKRTETLLRDARGALRRIDRLAVQAAATEDGTAPLISEARAVLEHVVCHLTHQHQDELRRARAAVKKVR